MSERFKILSLDGGGIKGAFSASFLAGIEAATGKRIVDYFDLITGTSTGGLIALGLGLGKTTEQLLAFYRESGPRIFPAGRAKRFIAAAKHLFRPKVAADDLRRELVGIFAQERLGEARCRLVINCFDAVAGDVHLFKTAHHSRLKNDYKVPALDVAMATAAPPTYFAAFERPDGEVFVDGGVWANCPVTVGLLEAMCNLGQDPENIDILSVGTTTAPYQVSKLERIGGALAWTWDLGLSKLLMRAQESAALAQAKTIMGRRVIRVDHLVKDGQFSLDDPRGISDLVALGKYAARHHEQEISATFLLAKARPFHPEYALDTAEVPKTGGD